MPLFVSTTPNNRLYVQHIGADDRIRSFETIDIGDVAIARHDGDLIRAVGDLALWAFKFEDGRCAIDMRAALRSTLTQHERRFSPLLRLQIGSLFEASDLAARMGDAHSYLGQIAPRSADLWRDLVILLPRIRQTAFTTLERPAAPIRAAIEAIDLVTHGDTVEISVPANLIEIAGGEAAFLHSLSPMRPIFAALGINHLNIQQRSFEAPADPQATAPPPRGLTIVHCLRDPETAPARKLREVRHLEQPALVDEDGVLDRTKLPDPREIVLLLVEDQKEQVGAATLIAQALVGRSAMTAALILPRVDEKEGSRFYRPIRNTEAISTLARHCRWIAFSSDVIDHDDDDDCYEPLGSNPHFDRQVEDVARWTPHALRACLNAGTSGSAALQALSSATARFGNASVASAASRSKDAGETAATAALTASKRTRHPAASAQLILLVAFHNRALNADTRNEIERAARVCNPEAKIVIVEEHRDDMVKRVRVVTITTGYQHVAREAYTPPAKLMPLVRAGWKVGPAPYDARWQLNTISHGGTSYILRFEPDLIVTDANVDEIIQATSLHHGGTALLVGDIADQSAVERLLSAGIFCGIARDRQSFDRFGHEPGLAMQLASKGLPRPAIAERLRHFARHYAVGGLWHLVPHWQRDSQAAYGRWKDGDYEVEPVLHQFEFYRIKDGTWFFRGIVQLDPVKEDVPALRYTFGLALRRNGVRLTRLKPLEGSFDIRADAQRRFEERYYAAHGRHFGKTTFTRVASTDGDIQQLSLPGLSEQQPAADH